MVYVFSGILLLSVAALCIKIILLKRSVREIADAFVEKTKTDTNTLIDVSVGDKDIINCTEVNTQSSCIADKQITGTRIKQHTVFVRLQQDR